MNSICPSGGISFANHTPFSKRYAMLLEISHELDVQLPSMSPHSHKSVVALERFKSFIFSSAAIVQRHSSGEVLLISYVFHEPVTYISRHVHRVQPDAIVRHSLEYSVRIVIKQQTYNVDSFLIPAFALNTIIMSNPVSMIRHWIAHNNMFKANAGIRKEHSERSEKLQLHPCRS
jgi:hypothetical protein